MKASLLLRCSWAARMISLGLLAAVVLTNHGIVRAQLGTCYATSEAGCYSSCVTASPEGCNSLCNDLCGGPPKEQASPTCGNPGACDPACDYDEACAWRTCKCHTSPLE
jgi:hypothetical protein